MTADLGRPRGAVVSVLASSAVATSAVLALVGGLVLVFGEPAQPAGAYAQGEERAADAGFDVPAPTTATTAPAEAEPDAEPAPSVAERDPRPPAVEVFVLNQTPRRGLAAEFREVLDDAGWKVGDVDSFRGTVPETTVYYPPGLRSAAQALNAAFVQVHRVRPAFTGIPTDKLTVILCKDYPST